MKLQIFGDYVFEFLTITFLFVLSLFLVIPFIPMVVGVTAYFKNDIHERRYKDIFIAIKENWKIILKFTIFELILLFTAILNIYFSNTHIDDIKKPLLIISYVGLIFGLFYLITAPTVILNMNVTLKQLLFNGLTLLFGNLKNTIISILLIACLVILVLYFPYVVFFVFYFMLMFNQSLMLENFYILKAKSLGVSIEELKHQPNDDDYLDELNRY